MSDSPWWISTDPSARRSASDTSPPSPKAIVFSSQRRCGSSSGSPAGTTRLAPRASPSISSALAAAIASTEPSSSRCAGPTLTITPTSGSAIAVSSAI